MFDTFEFNYPLFNDPSLNCNMLIHDNLTVSIDSNHVIKVLDDTFIFYQNINNHIIYVNEKTLDVVSSYISLLNNTTDINEIKIDENDLFKKILKNNYSSNYKNNKIYINRLICKTYVNSRRDANNIIYLFKKIVKIIFPFKLKKYEYRVSIDSKYLYILDLENIIYTIDINSKDEHIKSCSKWTTKKQVHGFSLITNVDVNNIDDLLNKYNVVVIHDNKMNNDSNNDKLYKYKLMLLYWLYTLDGLNIYLKFINNYLLNLKNNNLMCLLNIKNNNLVCLQDEFHFDIDKNIIEHHYNKGLHIIVKDKVCYVWNKNIVEKYPFCHDFIELYIIKYYNSGYASFVKKYNPNKILNSNSFNEYYLSNSICICKGQNNLWNIFPLPDENDKLPDDFENFINDNKNINQTKYRNDWLKSLTDHQLEIIDNNIKKILTCD